MKQMSRRTFLRGAGVAVGLPLLDAMAPAWAAGGGTPPVRMCCMYFPNGVWEKDWVPQQTGSDYELPFAQSRMQLARCAPVFRHGAVILSSGRARIA